MGCLHPSRRRSYDFSRSLAKKLGRYKEDVKWQIFHDAIITDNITVCEEVLKSGFAINNPGYYIHGRCTFCKCSDQNDSGIFCKDRNIRILHIAALYRRPEIMQLLLNFGADPNLYDDQGRNPLHVCVMTWPTLVIRDFTGDSLGLGSDESNFYRSYLESLKKRCLECVELLCSHDAAIQMNKADHLTAVHIAAEYDSVEILEILCRHYTTEELDTREAVFGLTPGMLAALKGSAQSLNLLLRRGVNIHLKSNGNRTMLHMAAASGKDDPGAACLKMLLERGLDPSVQDDDGWTPLHVAAKHKVWPHIKILFEYGANTEALCKSGQTPLFKYVSSLCSREVPNEGNWHIAFWPLAIDTVHSNITDDHLERLFPTLLRLENLNFRFADVFRSFRQTIVGEHPSDLRSICRHRIRQILTTSWHTYPCQRTIRKLPLPRLLKFFLIADMGKIFVALKKSRE
ncbi:ankyrin repeat domain-containing protein 61-like [Ptychodera flava]|uniref:ankyrin repeat domain-containing protein 61-like n=1 Tax=Ptychodera flava TaxID=63121 RepID=UPI003969F9DA